MDEQLFWAIQLQALGVAGKPLPAKKVTAKASAQAIRNVLSNASYREQAQGFSSKMKKSNGVAVAVKLIESHLEAVIV